MISCITLKNSSFKLLKIKNVDEENIYKKCGYKSSNNFSKLYTWNIDSSLDLELWSKQDTTSKVYNQHSIFLEYSINVNSNNRSIFLLKNKDNYINLDSKFFNAYFDLKEVIETETHSNEDTNLQDHNIDNKTKHSKSQNNTANDAYAANINAANVNTNTLINVDKNNVYKNNVDKNEDIDVNSELSYELYNYSDEEIDTL
jgi:hypothetical protein